MSCPLRNPSLFILKFDSATILFFKTIKSFSVNFQLKYAFLVVFNKMI